MGTTDHGLRDHDYELWDHGGLFSELLGDSFGGGADFLDGLLQAVFAGAEFFGPVAEFVVLVNVDAFPIGATSL